MKKSFLLIILIFFSCEKKQEAKEIILSNSGFKSNKFEKKVVTKKEILITDFLSLNNHKIFGLKKQEVLANFGKPLEIIIPEYECGSFSSEIQGQTFEVLHYSGFKMIGSEKGDYFCEEIDFEKVSKSMTISINEHPLSQKTSLQNFSTWFSNYSNVRFEGENAVFNTQSDYYIVFEFKNGKLKRIFLDESC